MELQKEKEQFSFPNCLISRTKLLDQSYEIALFYFSVTYQNYDCLG
jgi:hypothetical protein